MSDLVPQPHGGALRPPFAKGNGFASKGTSMRAVMRECRDLAKDASVDNTRKLISLCDDLDSRVSVAALTVFFKIFPILDDDGKPIGINAEYLSDEEVAHAMECAGHLRRYMALAKERAGGVEQG